MSTDLVAPTRIWRKAGSMVRKGPPPVPRHAQSISLGRMQAEPTERWSSLLAHEQTRRSRDRFGEQCDDVFRFVLAFEGAHRAPSPEATHLALVPRFREMAEVGEQLGLSRRDVEDAQFALVALIDEVALHSGITNRAEWESRPLQMICFGESTAGEEFFRRLERVGRSSGRREVLSVFFLCLVLGFEGRYRLGGTDEVARLRKELADLIGGVPKRSPSLFRSASSPVAAPRRRIASAKLGIAFLIALVVLFMGLRRNVRSAAEQLAPSAAEGSSSWR